MKFEFKCLQNKENRKERKEEKEKRKKPITPGPDYLLPLAHQPRWPAGGPSRPSGLRGRRARQV
jgi:hypothetical protein